MRRKKESKRKKNVPNSTKNDTNEAQRKEIKKKTNEC